jgi:hypothetical protein
MISFLKAISDLRNQTEDRVPSPVLRLHFDDLAFKTVHWSLSTFTIDAYEGGRRPGEEILIRGVAPERGPVRPVEIRARVVYFDDQKWRMEAVIVELDDADRDTLLALGAANEPDVLALRRLAKAS